MQAHETTIRDSRLRGEANRLLHRERRNKRCVRYALPAPSHQDRATAERWLTATARSFSFSFA
jgi:hypothetical protein